MPLVPMTQMLLDARRAKKAVGAFLPWDYESAYAIAAAAKALREPVIFLIGDMPHYMGGYKNIAAIARQVADELDMDIALHADHFRTYELVVEAITGGFTSVMIDASDKPLKENIALTRDVVRVAHACGVSVEAELGRLPGNECDRDVTLAEGYHTDPEEAAYFVEQTGIDILAVSIGTMHGAYPKDLEPKLNFARLAQIAERVSTPLVLHGGSGTPEAEIARAIALGISKVNVVTDVLTAYCQKIYQMQRDEPGIRYNLSLMKAGTQAAAQVVTDRIRLFTQNAK